MKRYMQVICFVSIFVLIGCSAIENDTENPASSNAKEDITEDSLLSPFRMLNIAHRGASGYAPEHTIPSYELAQEMDGDYLEIDLQQTKDGELIAMHDAEVDRTTSETGAVQDFSLETITGLNAGEWFNQDYPKLQEEVYSEANVPSLRDILDHFGKDANYYIETKQPKESPGMVDELIAVLEAYDLLDDDMPEGQIIIQSFSKESLLEMKAKAPGLPLVQLISYDRRAKISQEELDDIASYAIGIGANYHYITKDYVHRVRDAGLLLHPYTVNKKADMERMIEWGATGMFTNYPDHLEEVLAEMKN